MPVSCQKSVFEICSDENSLKNSEGGGDNVPPLPSTQRRPGEEKVPLLPSDNIVFSRPNLGSS